ncbi:MAG: isoprenylcysteine carboxylmethyltransferase family protein [Candidatus Sulfotelmatobacter sp.]
MEGRHVYILTAVQILAALALFWLLITFRGPWNWQRDLGTVLVVAGVGFIVLARFQLGRSFSIAPEARKLVTAGLYSKIRNPIYVFGAVLIAGVILVIQRPGLWIIFFIVVVGQVIRARREARVLEAAFGEDYREYRRKTWF